MRTIRPKKPMAKTCFFCDNKTEPDYKGFEVLRKFVSERGKIMSSSYSAICAKHQRRASRAIKRARFLGLLPYVAKV